MKSFYLMIRVILFTIISLGSIKVSATCNLKELTVTIPAFTATVPKGAYPGAVLADIEVPTGLSTGDFCDELMNRNGINNLFTVQSSTVGGTTIFNTNIQGIGVGVDMILNDPKQSVWSTNYTLGALLNYAGGRIDRAAKIRLKLVYTGGVISGGTLTGGVYSQEFVKVAGKTTKIMTINLQPGITIIPARCSIQQPNIPVNLGDINNNFFKGRGSASNEKGFNIKLDCDANADISIKFDGNAEGSNFPGVISLEKTKSTASGVGVQLLYKGMPISFANPVKITSKTAGGELDIPLSARYYQIADMVTGGSVIAYSTFTVTYN